MGPIGIDVLLFHEGHPYQQESKARKKEDHLGELAEDEQCHCQDGDTRTAMEQQMCITPTKVKALEMFVKNQPVTNREQEKENLLFPKDGAHTL